MSNWIPESAFDEVGCGGCEPLRGSLDLNRLPHAVAVSVDHMVSILEGEGVEVSTSDLVAAWALFCISYCTNHNELASWINPASFSDQQVLDGLGLSLKGLS